MWATNACHLGGYQPCTALLGGRAQKALLQHRLNSKNTSVPMTYKCAQGKSREEGTCVGVPAVSLHMPHIRPRQTRITECCRVHCNHQILRYLCQNLSPSPWCCPEVYADLHHFVCLVSSMTATS